MRTGPDVTGRCAPPPPDLQLMLAVQNSASKTGHDKPDSVNKRDKPAFTHSHQLLNKIGT